MVRRKDEVRIRRVEKPMGGAGEVFFHDWLLPEEAPGHGRVFSKVVVTPGSAIGYHQHKGEFEAVYIVEGVATLHDGEQFTKLYPGDMNLCKNGDFHGISNEESTDLVMLALIMNDLTVEG